MATEAQHKLVREAVILVTEKYGDDDGLLGKIADCIDSTAFYKFCASILSHLQPLSATREKNALSVFHRLSVTVLFDLWKDLCRELNIPVIRAVTAQSINRHLLNAILLRARQNPAQMLDHHR